MKWYKIKIGAKNSHSCVPLAYSSYRVNWIAGSGNDVINVSHEIHPNLKMLCDMLSIVGRYPTSDLSSIPSFHYKTSIFPLLPALSSDFSNPVFWSHAFFFIPSSWIFPSTFQYFLLMAVQSKKTSYTRLEPPPSPFLHHFSVKGNFCLHCCYRAKITNCPLPRCSYHLFTGRK